MIINERLAYFIEKKGLKITHLAALTKISQGALSDIKNSNREPKAGILEKFIRGTDINPFWLFLGEGPMERSPDAGVVNDEAAGAYTASNDQDGECAHIVMPRQIENLVRSAISILVSRNTILAEALTSNLVAFKGALDSQDEITQLKALVESQGRQIAALEKILHPGNHSTGARGG
jgi:transcriptional regulator with XRE-family HTH domain